MGDNKKGQYMVEFALSFSIFIIFVIFVIDLGLLIYNHNLFYHGVARGAREAGLGGTNEEIRQAVRDEIVGSYFPTIFLKAEVESIDITPSEEILRVDGREVEVGMDPLFGIGLPFLGAIAVEKPISSRMVIIQQNDSDRDGCKDDFSGSTTPCNSYRNFSSTSAGDHNNNGIIDGYRFNGSDTDPDGDGNHWRGDTVAIAYFNNASCAGYYIYRPHNDGERIGPVDCGTVEGISGTVWEDWFDGWYHAPEVWDDGTESPLQLFERKLPRRAVDNSSLQSFVRILRTAYDSDNDGWEDRFDENPDDPTVH
ncbi:MAG: TadE/TadG family type IV pilus assembly protein [bacterium]